MTFVIGTYQDQEIPIRYWRIRVDDSVPGLQVTATGANSFPPNPINVPLFVDPSPQRSKAGFHARGFWIQTRDREPYPGTTSPKIWVPIVRQGLYRSANPGDEVVYRGVVGVILSKRPETFV